VLVAWRVAFRAACTAKCRAVVVSRSSGTLRDKRQPCCRTLRTRGHRYVVVDHSPTTILPPTPRPGGRIEGSSSRHSARHSEAHNQTYFETNNEPNDDANNHGNNVSNNFADSSLRNAAYSCSRSSPFSYRCIGRRSSLHTALYPGRYLEGYNERYIDGRNERSSSAREESGKPDRSPASLILCAV